MVFLKGLEARVVDSFSLILSVALILSRALTLASQPGPKAI